MYEIIDENRNVMLNRIHTLKRYSESNVIFKKECDGYIKAINEEFYDWFENDNENIEHLIVLRID